MKFVAALTVAALVTGGCSFLDRDRGDRREPGVLRMGLVRPASLDPMKAKTVDEQLLADQIFDTLVAVDPETLEPGPGLASWTASDDGLVWEFTLEGDQTFSDGEPITALDVEASLERAVQKDAQSVTADLLEPIAGWKAVAIDGSTTDLAGVTAVGATVVRVELTSPWADLPLVLAQPAFGIVPREVARAADFPDRPVGSGPFAVVAHTATRLELRPAEGPQGRDVKLAGIDVLFYDDQGEAYEAFVGDAVDWSPVPAARVEEAATRYGRNYFRTYVAELFYAFNLRQPKWADRRLREAVVRAVDRRAIIDDVYGGTLSPMVGFVVDGIPGAFGDACGELCAHDPERAKALIAEVTGGGATPLPEIAIDFEGDETQSAVAELVKAGLEAVGFTVTLRPRPLPEYESFAVSGEQDLFRLGWIAAYPSPDAFLAPLFTSGSANNLAGFALGRVDELIREARAASDTQTRFARYQEAERMIFAELPVVPIGHFRQHWVANPRVRNLTLTVTGTFDGSVVWLADD